jgi:hypothetical protein
MRANEEQHYGHGKEEFLGRRVLVPVIDLLPHVEVVEGTAVEIKGYAADMVKHEVRSKHVRHVRQRP